MIPGRDAVPGIVIVLLVGALAAFAGHLVPTVGAPVAAILLGIVVRAAWRPGPRFTSGIRWASRLPLQAAIVVLGTGISFAQVARVGLGTLPLIAVTMTVCLIAAAVIGRALRLDGTLRTLLGVGTAVCGASAIAAVAPVIGAGETEIALALTTVFFYNVCAVFAFPAIGHAIGLSQHGFALWAGTAINDTSSVVAAAYAYGHSAGDEAVVVKLVRATTIVLIVVALAIARRERGVAWWTSFPVFLPWFLIAAALDTFGVIPAALHPALTALGVFLIAVALAAIGLQTDGVRFVRAGWRPLIFGFLLWAIVAVSSLAIQYASGAL